jgi:hypothetical protein
MKAQRGSRGIAQHHTPALPPGMTRYPLYRRLGGPQGRSGRMQKILPPPGFNSRTAQLVASRYTDYAIPAHFILEKQRKTDLFGFDSLAGEIQKFCWCVCIFGGQTQQQMIPQRVQEQTTQLQMVGHILPQLNLCKDRVQ